MRAADFARMDATADALRQEGVEVRAGGHRGKARRSRPEPNGAGEPHLITAPEFSEDAIALTFVDRGADQFRWSPGLGWMRDDGIVWTRDDALRRYNLARVICREAATFADGAEGKRIASARTVNGSLSLAQSDPRIVVSADAWDCDPMLLNTPGGVVDLRSGVVEPRGARYVTQAARVAPVDAACPTWEKFVDDVFLGDRDLIEFMRRSLGYTLTGNRREQVLFFWYGLGANGKSVLAELVQWLAGSYAIKLPASALMQAKGERHPTELAQLRGKRLAVSSELDEHSFFNESLIKELTGDETLSARFMRGDFFEFTMEQKHVIVGNFKPRLRGGDPAMVRRLLLVPFNASFKGSACDPLMLERLKAEAPGILHWIVRGASAWASEGLAIPESVRAASNEYMNDNDDLALWMDECCEREGEARAGDLYASFAAWKKGRGENAPSQTAWSSRLSSVPGLEKRKSSGIWYAGVRLTATEIAHLNGSR